MQSPGEIFDALACHTYIGQGSALMRTKNLIHFAQD